MKKDIINILIDIVILIAVILAYIPISNKFESVNTYAQEVSDNKVSITNNKEEKKLTIDGANYNLYLMINKNDTTIDMNNLNIIINNNSYNVNDMISSEDDNYLYYKVYTGSDKEINYDLTLDDNKKGKLSYNFSVM